MHQRFLRTLLPVAAVLAVPHLGFAQTSAAMTGIVTDTAGAVVPDATVTLVNSKTGLKFTAVSDSTGSYRFTNVPAGPGYKATVERSGFATQIIQDLYLNVGITRTQDVKLTAGTSVQVEVSAKNHEVTLNTTDASIGNNFEVQQVNELPIQDRGNIQTLFVLQPGVTSTGSVTGARQDQNEVTLDGMDLNDISAGQGTTGTFPVTGGAPPDAIQEFRGVTAGLPTILGTGSGGQFQLVSKSGTNTFHGNVNEYHRDVSTVANSWFNLNLATPLPRPKLIRNQFGGALGGPIIKDKLFFFGDLNVGRIVQQSTQTATVPLDSFRAGTLGYTNNSTGCNASSRRTTQASCISEYSPAQTAALDPLSIGNNAALFAYINQRYPRANDLSLGDGVNTGGYRFLQATPNNTYNYLADVDYNLSHTQSLKLQYHAVRTDAVQALNRFDTDPLTFPQQNRSYGYVGTHVWQIGSNKVNQAYYGTTVSVLNFPVNFFATGNTSYGFGPLTAPNGSLNAQRRRVPIPEFRDDFNWTLGKHTIQVGGTFKFIKTNSLNRNDYNFATAGIGGLTTSLATGGVRPANLNTNATVISRFDSAYAFALGRLASVSRNYNYDASGAALPIGTGAIRRYRYYQTELYLGDTWKISPTFTLSYGVRYQYYSVPYEVNGIQSNPSTSFNDYVTARVAQSAAGTSGNAAVPFISYNLGGKANNAGDIYNPDTKNIAPRIGFAYAPTQLPKTVFNGGFNIVYDRTVVNAVNFVQDQLSYLFQNSQSQSYGNANARTALANDPRLGANLSYPTPPAAVAVAKPFTPYVTAAGVPTGIVNGQTSYAVDKNLKNPYNYAFNLGMQHEFKGGFVVSGNYVGRIGRRLLGQADASQLLDFVDRTSGQTMNTAFSALTTAVRTNNPATTAQYNALPRQAWFENQMTTNGGYASKTAYAAALLGQTAQIGDFADSIQTLQANGLIARNVGLPAQFAGDTFITNRGFSNYNGGLFTLSKNTSAGLTFQFNYTYAHSMDNVSAVANTIGLSSGTGQICDVTNSRACYGNSDFDVKHTITSDFVYDLPFGRSRRFGSNINRFLDLAVGGWGISGIPGWRSGVAFNSSTGAFLAGYANNISGVFNGDQSAVKVRVHKDSANRLQLFDDPVRAAAAFRNPIGFEYGSRNNLRGPSAFTFDAGLAKRFTIYERLNFQFRADAFNVLNHPVFANPTYSSSTNINNAGTFGQLTGVASNTAARVAQFSGRIEF